MHHQIKFEESQSDNRMPCMLVVGPLLAIILALWLLIALPTWRAVAGIFGIAMPVGLFAMAFGFPEYSDEQMGCVYCSGALFLLVAIVGFVANALHLA